MLAVAQSTPTAHHSGMALTPKFIIDRTQALERLELVRRASGLTKKAFAASLGMYAPNYSRMLKGEFFLTNDQLYTVWQLYGADPAYIMAGKETGVDAGLVGKIRGLAANA